MRKIRNESVRIPTIVKNKLVVVLFIGFFFLIHINPFFFGGGCKKKEESPNNLIMTVLSVLTCYLAFIFMFIIEPSSLMSMKSEKHVFFVFFKRIFNMQNWILWEYFYFTINLRSVSIQFLFTKYENLCIACEGIKRYLWILMPSV